MIIKRRSSSKGGVGKQKGKKEKHTTEEKRKYIYRGRP